MNWKAKLFKPQWESRQPEKRLKSVRADQQAEFWQALPGIIQSDPDYRVRLAALERLLGVVKAKDPIQRFEFIYALLRTTEGDSGIEQQAALNQYLAKVKQHIQRALSDLPIDSKTATDYLQQHGDSQLRDKLAQQAKASSVRRAAIELTTANGKLGDLAITETDAQLRQLAVSKIEQTSTLERVAKALRTKDKKLFHAINERLLENQGDGHIDANKRHAEAICSQLEELIKNPGLNGTASLQQVETSWQQISAPSNTLQQRYITLRETLKIAISGSAVKIVAVPEVIPEKPVPSVVLTTPEVKPVKPDNNKIKAAQRAEQRQQQLDTANELAATISTQQDQLAEKIEAVELTPAVKLLYSLRQAISQLRKHPQGRKLVPPLDGRQSRLHGRVRELRDWQHWSNNKIRTELIATMRNLESSLHPDAVMTAMRDARERWKQLEAGEQLPGDKYTHAPAKLWREFNQACEQAYQHIKPFLDKRHEIQDEHLQQDQQLLQDGLELLQAEKPQLKQLIQQQRDLRAAMRSLEKIPANKRGKFANRIRKQLDALQTLIGSAFEVVELEKSRLIGKAEQLKHIEDPQAAIEQAKQLQRQWQASGSGRRKQEQELWEKFRVHLDPLFAQQKEAKNAQQEIDNEQLAQLQDVCKQLAKINNNKGAELVKQSGIVQSLQSKWLEHSGDKLRGQKKLQQRYQTALEKYASQLEKHRQKQLQLEQKARQSKNLLLQKLLKLLEDQPENMAAAAKKIILQWPPTEGSKIDKLLDAKFTLLQQSLQAEKVDFDNSDANLDSYRDTCLSLEYLAGLESPKAEKKQRMELQIARLSANLSGEKARLPLQQEVAELELEWYQLPLPGTTKYKAYSKRFNQAMNELQIQLGNSG